jgi:3-oxoacyl-[acyl-carrier protein] reductase
MGKLNGKVAVVTGASKGIGAGIAKALAAAGASVVVNYASSRQGADLVVKEITGQGGKAVAIQGNVSKEDDVRRLFQESKKAFGPLNILVNNAGVYLFQPLESVTPEEFHRQFKHQRSGTDHGDAGSGKALWARRRKRDQHRVGCFQRDPLHVGGL